MVNFSRTVELSCEDRTADFARRLALCLKTGDTILLEGGVGAGKSFLARYIILTLLSEPEDIPSPTFTLVQSYDSTIGEILHADLYRIAGPEGIVELGLQDAFGTAVCLVEWPDRLGPDTPDTNLRIHLKTHEHPDHRTLTGETDDAAFAARLEGLFDG